jgi:hypothetical protein
MTTDCDGAGVHREPPAVVLLGYMKCLSHYVKQLWRPRPNTRLLRCAGGQTGAGAERIMCTFAAAALLLSAAQGRSVR